jgi:hypothetical protein
MGSHAMGKTPSRESFFILTRFLPQIIRNLRKLDCYANRVHFA